MRPRHLQLLALPLLLVLAVPLMAVVEEMPTYGHPNPTFNYVVDYYTEHALEETGATNIVTGIILDYRAYDTLIETTVFFTATMGVFLALLGSTRKGRTDGRRHHP